MFYKQYYRSPLGLVSLIADDDHLLGAWFVNQNYFEAGFENAGYQLSSNPVLEKAIAWLEAYFRGNQVEIFSRIAPQGTDFQKKVWSVLVSIPQGETRTYGEIAQVLGCRSAQAVGGAVGKNPLSMFIPCHRVLGSQGQLTGYAGGLERKKWLLEHEGALKSDTNSKKN